MVCRARFARGACNPQLTVLGCCCRHTHRLRRRLETILDSDRILALDDGHVAEFDTPQALLSNPDSLLTGLVEAAGPEVAAKLRAIAAGGPAGASAAAAAVVHAGVPATVPEV